MSSQDIIKVYVYDSEKQVREAEVFYKFEYEGRGYCAVTTVEEPFETQILGYGYNENGEFFTYDIVERLYKNVVDTFTGLYLPDMTGTDDSDEAPIINVQGIGNERSMKKKGQALMFFSYGITEEKQHDYVLVAYIEPEVPEHRAAFYRYEFIEMEDGRNAIATEPIRNDMEYEAVKAYFDKEKGKELKKLLIEERIDLRY